MGIDGFPSYKNENKLTAEKSSYALIERALQEVEHITDGLNLSIDEGIREAVAVLRAMNFETTQSCEGHLDRGSPSPYIDIQAHGEPAYRFQGEREQLEVLAYEHDLEPDEVKSWPREEDRARRAELAYNEWMRWCGGGSREETPEYAAWDKTNQGIQAVMEHLIQQFYAARNKPREGYILLDHGRLRTASALYDRHLTAAMAGETDGLTSFDREHLRDTLPVGQAEMAAFIGFLKNTFFALPQTR